jgi:hypothetical protein
MASVLSILDGLQNTYVKEAIRDQGFMIKDIRDELSERITACENKLEEHYNILADILSRLTHAGI